MMCKSQYVTVNRDVADWLSVCDAISVSESQ